MAGMPFILHIATFVSSLFKSHRQLTPENLALRQQLAMLKPSVKRPQVSPADRLFWILFSKYVDGWRTMLHALHPDTVVRWHREGFRLYWTWKCERIIGSIRRDCLDHVIVLNERHLRRILREYIVIFKRDR
jgi:hypothetical protein